jgi:thymidylate kinase
MKLWMRERDQLIETTLAFVEGVSGARPRNPAADPVRTEPAKKAESVRPVIPMAIMLPVSPASERAEIERRVAKFKAQQQKFQREREASYAEIFSKTRATRGNAARA